MMTKNNKKRPSESFILAVVALVFLIIGYQTAMFVYRAAVMKIAANRDEPDTVYVYQHDEMTDKGSVQSGTTPRNSHGGTSGYKGIRSERRNSSHSTLAQSVRQNLPRRKIESFSFNPNTVSEDDLCRLGFTPKQAQSIVSYRKKGGRFRRKADFAKSFVVSDSIFRRLEPYIDIPLIDLNEADSAAFDSLPGIGGWFAAKMVSYRTELKGYSYKEQLMDIWKFDQEKYAALEDLITVVPGNVTPYPLWDYPADSLRRRPYIRNYETARAIVLYRENTPREKWTVENLSAAGILSESAADKLSRCVIAAP